MEDEIASNEDEDEDEEDSDGSFSEEIDEDEDDYEEDEEEVDESNPLRRDRGIKTMSDAPCARAEIEKGNCVREQLKMWENLLEMRIKLQKCLVNSNAMPQYDSYGSYHSDSDLKRESNNVRSKLGGVLSALLELQSDLLGNFPETKDLMSGQKRKAEDENEDEDEEIPSDTDEDNQEEDEVDEKGPKRKKMKLADFERAIAKNHKLYGDYRNSVIQKWNDKTRIASGTFFIYLGLLKNIHEK